MAEFLPFHRKALELTLKFHCVVEGVAGATEKSGWNHSGEQTRPHLLLGCTLVLLTLCLDHSFPEQLFGFPGVSTLLCVLLLLSQKKVSASTPTIVHTTSFSGYLLKFIHFLL